MLLQVFRVERYELLELNILDTQVVDEVRKNTLDDAISIRRSELCAVVHTASDSMVFHPPDMSQRPGKPCKGPPDRRVTAWQEGLCSRCEDWSQIYRLDLGVTSGLRLISAESGGPLWLEKLRFFF